MGQVQASAIQAAKDIDLHALVSRYTKLKREGTKHKGCCPVHKEKTPSFYVFPEGKFHCFGCGANGDAIDFVRLTENLSFIDAIDSLSGARSERWTQPKPDAPRATPARDAHAREKGIVAARIQWRRGRQITGTLAQTYLASRGIKTDGNPSLRFISDYLFAPGVVLPAMLAAIADENRAITAVQFTLLDPSGLKKASTATPRRVGKGGVLGTGAVRLAPATDVLGLAEGVETALSAAQIFRVPVWATIGAGRMPTIAIPPSVRTLIVFADNDEPGTKAAEATIESIRLGLTAEVRRPPAGFKDFNSMLTGGKT